MFQFVESELNEKVVQGRKTVEKLVLGKIEGNYSQKKQKFLKNDLLCIEQTHGK